MVWQPYGQQPVAKFMQLEIGEFHSSQLAGRLSERAEKKKVKDKATDWRVSSSQIAYLRARCEALPGILPTPPARAGAADCYAHVDLTKWSAHQVW